jgi:hypothetical protein
LLALYKVRKLVDGEMRFRTACDFVINDSNKTVNTLTSTSIPDFKMPSEADLSTELKDLIGKSKAKCPVLLWSSMIKWRKKADKEKDDASDADEVPE